MRLNPPETLGSEESVTLQLRNYEPLETPRKGLIDSVIEDQTDGDNTEKDVSEDFFETPDAKPERINKEQTRVLIDVYLCWV